MIKSLPIVPQTEKLWNCLAKALYDNSAETPDELSFQRGDILTVLEQNPSGLEGWWLCSLRGRQGIAPGNRLRLIPGTFDSTWLGYGGCMTPHGSSNCINFNNVKSSSSSTLLSCHNSNNLSSSCLSSSTTIDSRRRSWHINPNKEKKKLPLSNQRFDLASVITPHKIGDVYLYDIPNNEINGSNTNMNINTNGLNELNQLNDSFNNININSTSNSKTLPNSKINSSMKSSASTSSLPAQIHQMQITKNNLNKLNSVRCKSPHESYDTPPSPKAVSNERLVKSIDGKNKLIFDKKRSASAELLSCKDNDQGDDDFDDLDNYDVPKQSTNLQSQNIDCNEKISRVNLVKMSFFKDVEAYDVPPPPNKISFIENYDIPLSNRTSGVANLSSSSSSGLSSSGSRSSLDTSLSLSSFGGSNRSSLEQHPYDVYDIPPEPRRIQNDKSNSPITMCHSPKPNGQSDFLSAVPPPPSAANKFGGFKQNLNLAFYDIPMNNGPTDQAGLDQHYDIPKCNSIASQSLSSQVNNGNHFKSSHNHITSSQSLSSSSSSSSSSISNDSLSSKESITFTSSIPSSEKLNIDMNEALQMQMNLTSNVQSAINDLFKFVTGTSWRSIDNLSGKIADLELSCHNLKNNLKQFLFFGYGALANATEATDKSLSNKLNKLLKQLNDSFAIIESTTNSIDEKGWTLIKLALTNEDDSLGQTDGRKKTPQTPDELDQLVACARGLIEDVKHIGSFIRGNVKLMFSETNINNSMNKTETSKPPIAPKPPITSKPLIPKSIGRKPPPPAPPKESVQSRPLPPVPRLNISETKIVNDSNESSEDDGNDYDYISLEAKETKQNQVTNQFEKSFDKIVKINDVITSSLDQQSEGMKQSNYGQLCDAIDSATKKDNNTQVNIQQSDCQVLQFYLLQLETNRQTLANAIDALIQTVNNNQPPKDFVEQSKFVVVSAQKLICIGETIHRNVKHNEIRSQVSKCSNSLSESLKCLVSNTKKAANQFPSVLAVQEMIDNVVDVSHSANQLKVVIVNAAKK